MNLISSGLADLAGLLDSATSFLRSLVESTGLLVDDSPDGWSGILMSGAAGIAA